MSEQTKFVTAKEMSELFDKQLRISKTGCSVKCGNRIVAKSPVAAHEAGIYPEKFQQWLEDAERLCELWNGVGG